MSTRPAVSIWVENSSSQEGATPSPARKREYETGRSFIATQTALRRMKGKG